MALRIQANAKWNSERVAKFHADLQKIEIRTMHYLGLAYLVLSHKPQLKLKVPLSTLNYDEGHPGGLALQLIFTCPRNYPLQKPKVEIVEKRNIAKVLEEALLDEIDLTLDQHFGLQMIVPVVTRLQMLLNAALRRQTLES
ncbi:uncharacterized protein Dwil_GK18885 [Drosophila willistoni]|uniref:RWD domain-containing protein n=1 Tax=Drosophila willistoni TaxID=7260 RepID=B4N5S5_DROWI|nr:uncharacterized protein LOC6646178 [Drosophila willistoni]EDW79714.1 uncharacterized protein Dwil_GK18885 [Drosophila willistoni]